MGKHYAVLRCLKAIFQGPCLANEEASRHGDCGKKCAKKWISSFRIFLTWVKVNKKRATLCRVAVNLITVPVVKAVKAIKMKQVRITGRK